jgi:hypothetical protein
MLKMEQCQNGTNKKKSRAETFLIFVMFYLFVVFTENVMLLLFEFHIVLDFIAKQGQTGKLVKFFPLQFCNIFCIKFDFHFKYA